MAHALEVASLQENSRHSNNANFEELQNEMMKKYGFVGLNGAVSFDTPKNTTETLLGVNTDKTARPRTHTFGENALTPTEKTGASAKRALSMSQPDRALDWTEIPPVIPPREPLRYRTSPPLRSCSTPSPTSSLQIHFSTASSANFSATTPENSRPKFPNSSSTTAVFSALPPGLSNSHPVILPIMKDGKQESHTHYFLLGDDKVSLNLRMKKLNFRSSPFEVSVVQLNFV